MPDRYIVIAQNDLKSLCLLVDKRMDDRYIPVGGVTTSVSGKDDIIYYQSMILDETESIQVQHLRELMGHN